MPNMSYCRFQNTLGDLEDCFENMGEIDKLSREEKIARTKMIELAKDIIEDFGHEINVEIADID